MTTSLTTLETVDRKTTAVVSGTTQTKIVGQKVTLRVRTKPDGRSPSNIQWTIPGQAVKDYQPSGLRAEKKDLINADLYGADSAHHLCRPEDIFTQVKTAVNRTEKHEAPSHS